MKDLQEELNQAYELLCAIPVNGDAVDIMAGVREHLRRAYHLAKESQGADADG